MTYLTNDSFNSQFNADWANKLLICIDEVLFNKEELTERIKYLSTTNINKIESKGKDKQEVEFFGKFILCSNNEEGFIKIDADEIRFWIVKVPVLKNDDVDFLMKLIEEIPAFMHFIQNRRLVSTNNSRMWFTPEQIRTKALDKLIRFNTNKEIKELAIILNEAMESLSLDKICICPNDIVNLFNKYRIKISPVDARYMLKKQMKLYPQENSLMYNRLIINYDGNFAVQEGKGRYYIITKEYLQNNFDELML